MSIHKGRIPKKKRMCPECHVRERAVSRAGKIFSYCRICHNDRQRNVKHGIENRRSTFDWQGSGLSPLYSVSKSNAARKGQSFTISKSEWFELVKKNCHYCGNPPSNRDARAKIKIGGIDRVDSSKGYDIDNIVPCCKFCNYMKRDHSTKDWIAQMMKILDHEWGSR